jgi:hypothetical protein
MAAIGHVCPRCAVWLTASTSLTCPLPIPLGDGWRQITGQQITGPKISHPAHYGGDTTYEAIKVIEAWSLNFCLGNTLKYISRAGKKDPACFVEDLEKARWYLDREIANQKAKR